MHGKSLIIQILDNLPFTSLMSEYVKGFSPNSLTNTSTFASTRAHFKSCIV